MTKNNSTSMKTVVETYIIEETQELIYDNEKLDQWNAHVAALGLEGQAKIQVKDKSPIPFLHMKASLVNVFTQLCPRHVEIKDYDKTPIPVEILDLAALSVKECYFNKIQIWYDDATPDPACIGVLGEWYAYGKGWQEIGKWATKEEMQSAKSTYTGVWQSEGFRETAYYLVGRWADVKMSLEQLTKKARALFMASEKSSIDQRIRDEKRKLEDLEHDADRKFGIEGDINVPLNNLPF
jgi:hypothetical protein